MKKLLMVLLIAVVAATIVALSAGSSFAAAPACEAGDPGCKTAQDTSKNNPKFTVTQRGNIGAGGTENTCTGANPGQTKQVCG